MRKIVKYCGLVIALTLVLTPSIFAYRIVRIHPIHPHHHHSTVLVPATPRHGTIKTDIEPKSASVYVNGGYVGKADSFDGVFQGLDLRPGKYEVKFVAPGYKPLTMKIYVAPGETLKLQNHLVPTR